MLASTAASDALLCGRKPAAFVVVASRKSVIGVASANTLGFRFRTSAQPDAARRRSGEVACRRRRLPLQRHRATPGRWISRLPIYRAKAFATTISSALVGSVADNRLEWEQGWRISCAAA